MPGRGPDLPAPDVDDIDSGFKRRLAVSVALIAFFGGLVGFAATDAGARAAQIGRDAQRSSVEALAEQGDAANAYYESYGNFVEGSTLRRQADLAGVAAELLGGDRAAAQARAWRQASGTIDDASALLAEERYRGRPDRLFNELNVAPNLALLRQQAAQETASAWATKGNRYLGVITLLAVALTLLGLSLTVGLGVRQFLIWPAVLIVAACLVGATLVLVRPATTTSDAAIQAVADGDRLAWGRDFEQAVAAYTRAIELDGDYVTPYQRRATATLLAGSPERDASSYVFSSSSRLARLAAIEDLLQAVARGGGDYVTLVNLGANYFHVADYARSEEYTRRAIALNDDLPIPWSNLTLALAAQGRETEALSAAEHSLRLIAARPYLGERREMFASLRATLETLAGQEKAHEELARRLQGMAVDAQFAMEVPGATDSTAATVSDLTATSAGAALSISMTVRGMTEGSRVGIVVSYLPAGQPDWSETALQSGFYRWQFPTSTEAQPYSAPLYVEGCHTSGSYRVAVYSGARQLASVTVPQKASQLNLVQHTDVVGRLQLCRPQDWTFAGATTGSVDLTAPDGQRSLSMRSLPLAVPPDTGSGRDAVVADVLDRLSDRLDPNAVITDSGLRAVSQVNGTARFLRLSSTEDGYVWASLGPDNVLRAVYARFPTGTPGQLDEVIAGARFLG
jgi:tetratricopeptide (TPR) repeat protein